MKVKNNSLLKTVHKDLPIRKRKNKAITKLVNLTENNNEYISNSVRSFEEKDITAGIKSCVNLCLRDLFLKMTTFS